MKVLVTGGSGFIGSHVVDKLLAAGHEPRHLRPAPLALPRPGEVETVVGDLLDPDALARRDGRLRRGHPPGRRRRRRRSSPSSPRSAEAVNARGTLTVLEAARAAGDRPRRLRQHDLGLRRRRRRRHASTRTRRSACPAHLYTASKLAGEMYCTLLRASSTTSTCTILRFGIPYGPRARPAAVIPIFVAQGARRRGADDRRRRQPVAPLRLRRGPRRGRRRGARPAADNRVYNLAERRDGHDPRARRDGPGARRRRRDRPHPGPQRRLRRRRDLEPRAPSASSAGAPQPRSARE